MSARHRPELSTRMWITSVLVEWNKDCAVDRSARFNDDEERQRHLVAVYRPPMMQPKPANTSQLLSLHTKFFSMMMIMPVRNKAIIRCGTHGFGSFI